MKRIIILLILGSIAMMLPAQKTARKAYIKTDENGRQVWWRYNNKGTKSVLINGFYKVHFDDCYALGHFRKGIVKEGVVSYFYPDGTLWRTVGYDVKGYVDGIQTDYYTNGNLRRRIGWRKGVAHGEHSEWFENGQQSFSGIAAYGKREGTATAWNQRGDTLSVWNYKYGMKDGRCTTWIYTDSILTGRLEEVCKADQPSDSALYFVVYPDGKERLQSRTRYDSDGKITLIDSYINDIHNRMEYEDGALTLISQFTDGRLSSTAQYKDNRAHGKTVMYYPGTDRIYKVEIYRMGRLTGSAEYDIKGLPRSYKVLEEDGQLHPCDSGTYKSLLPIDVQQETER